MNIYKTYKDCMITKGDARVLLPYISDNRSDMYKLNKGYHTGIDIEASEVYNMYTGTVIQVGIEEDNSYAVTVEYNGDIALRYMNLLKAYVTPGDYIYLGAFIGSANKFVHFEYVNTRKDDSIWPVRVGEKTYYKHDPEVIFDGRLKLRSNNIM